MAGHPRPISFGNVPPAPLGHKYDQAPPDVAVMLAWTEAGLTPKVHAIQQDAVRQIMPNLAAALDRLAAKKQEPEE